MSPDELRVFFQQFQDFLAPKLDTYEQAIYLYVFRHSRFLGVGEVVIGFKSTPKRLPLGIGQDGTPMSEGVVYRKLRTLQEKGYVAILATEHNRAPGVPYEVPVS